MSKGEKIPAVKIERRRCICDLFAVVRYASILKFRHFPWEAPEMAPCTAGTSLNWSKRVQTLTQLPCEYACVSQSK